MENSTRQLKVAKELQKDLAEIIRSKGVRRRHGVRDRGQDKSGPVCRQGLREHLPVSQGGSCHADHQ